MQRNPPPTHQPPARFVIQLALGLLLAASATPAQVSINGSGELDVTSARVAATAVATGDFDGNGFDDIALGFATDAVNGLPEAGRVVVLYGTRSGPDFGFEPERVFDESIPNLIGAPAAGNGFGSRLVAADFDGDLYDDLAITAPGALEFNNVTVLKGSPSGLGAARAQRIAGGGLAILNLAAGDFNRDHRADLAIAAPRPRSEDASDLLVYYGSPTGLAFGAQFRQYRDVSFGLPTSSRQVYSFGSRMATGDFEGDGYDDLVLATPDGFNTTVDHGWAGIVRGSPTGLLLDELQLVSTFNLLDGFGAAIAVGDFDGDGRDDLVSREEDGDVFALFRGLAGGGVATSAELRPSPVRALRMVAGDIDGDGRDDLVVADPTGPGEVAILLGSPTGPTTPGDSIYAPNTWVQSLGRLLAVANANGGGLDIVAGTLPAPFSPRTRHGVVLDNVRSGDPPGVALRDGRFEVEVAWRDFQGNRGFGRPVLQSDDSAVFYFFEGDNWELMVKVLDACPLNQRFWTFFAATTNVEFTVRVTDTASGVTRTYSNPLGRSADAVTDTDSFSTCGS